LSLQPNLKKQEGHRRRKQGHQDHDRPSLGDDGPEQEGDEENRGEGESQGLHQKLESQQRA
jgi:hypothetical protein